MHLVLITGGAGFIGSHTAHRLLAQQVRVRVLDDLSSGRLDNLDAVARADGRIDFVQADVRDEAAVRQAVQGCDAVRQLRIPRLVYASSAAVFGTRALLPVSEASELLPVSPYGLEKLVNEQYAALYGALYGVSSLGMRYFNVYGALPDPDSPYAGVISKFAAALARDAELSVFGDGLQTRDFVYVGDVAEANVRALAAPYCGVLNLATGSSTSLLQLIESMGSAFGKPAKIRHVPAIAGDIRHSATTADLARSALDWNPGTPLTVGLQALVASLRSPAP